jgi:hypothetical protein
MLGGGEVIGLAFGGVHAAVLGEVAAGQLEAIAARCSG